jgi:hypothetical protein
MKICEKCSATKEKRIFFSDSQFPDRCKECFTDLQLNRYLQSPLTKAMKGLNPHEKR